METSKRRSLPRLLLLCILLALLPAGPTLAARGRASHAAPALVKTTSAKLLVNAQGLTLYVFAPDKPNKSVCTGKCAVFWPPAVVPKGTKVPAAMAGITGTFGAARRSDGTQQLTFDRAPLYTFVKDKKPGEMTGQGLNAFGGYWWVVGVQTSSSSSGGPGGY